MLAARCLMLNSYLIDRYFSVHLTTNIGDVKLSTNVVYGRNGLSGFNWIELNVSAKLLEYYFHWLKSYFWNHLMFTWKYSLEYYFYFRSCLINLSPFLLNDDEDIRSFLAENIHCTLFSETHKTVDRNTTVGL